MVAGTLSKNYVTFYLGSALAGMSRTVIGKSLSLSQLESLMMACRVPCGAPDRLDKDAVAGEAAPQE